MKNKIDSCYVCQGTPATAVGAFVSGDTTADDFVMRVAAVLSCAKHEAEVSRRVVAESWNDLVGKLAAQTFPGVAVGEREEWLREQVASVAGEEGPTPDDFAEALRSEPDADVMGVTMALSSE
ncbi:hypothetical protein [Dermacoccus nishinomiyaensis]|nr:hypothetical protein [Dermacoccus nishinomiyaensis]